MSNPFVFIVGCSRSGTTLLQHVVAAHPQIAIIPETRWFARWYEKRCGITADGMVTSELISRLLDKHRLFRDLDLGIGPEELYALIAGGRGMLYQDFVAFLFDRYGEARGKPLVGNKTPGFVRRLAILHELWPRAKFVHIIRDGRDVCLSMMQMRAARSKPTKPGRFATIDEDPMITMALWWEWDVRLGREAGDAFGPQCYYEMRYESLVAEPDAACRGLCAFLGVPYDDEMLAHHRAKASANPRMYQKHSRLELPITAGLRDWRHEMSPADAERFEASAGELLDELGYPRTTVPDSALVERAKLMRRSFQGRPHPQCWSPAIS
jgi:Sulfotransferase family